MSVPSMQEMGRAVNGQEKRGRFLLPHNADSRQERSVPPVCLPARCLVVSSRERLWPLVQLETINGEGGGGGGVALPLRMTPPWPFSTRPHCASTEPCGDRHTHTDTRSH